VAAALAAAGAPPGGPVVLVVEDLHWSDRSTRDLLGFLLRRLRDERLLVVASYRGDDLHRRHPLRMFLAELTRLLAAGRRDGAAAELAAARRTAGELGARPLAAALDALARRAGMGSGPRPAGPLTPRESEVLGLVAQGLTNRRIGERLFMAEKTVSVHVSRIIAKLGVTGRTEAVTVAHREGLLADRAPSGRG
jgi:DNA-binding CsgD family transcriptional regulator